MQGLGLLSVEALLCLLRLWIEVWCNILSGLFHYLIHTWPWIKQCQYVEAFKKHFCNHIKGFCPQTCRVHCGGVCEVEWLTPWTPDLKVRGSSLSRCFLRQGIYSTLSLFSWVCKWVPATYCWGVTLDGLASCPGGSSNTPRCFMLMKPG